MNIVKCEIHSPGWGSPNSIRISEINSIHDMDTIGPALPGGNPLYKIDIP